MISSCDMIRSDKRKPKLLKKEKPTMKKLIVFVISATLVLCAV